jgi:hypothetical protein
MLVCPHFAVTFYPAPWPSEAGGVALVTADDLVEAGSNLAVAAEQMMQRADYLRGEVPDFFPRGNRSGRLEWETLRRHAAPSGAAAAALAAAETLPRTVGWARVALAAEGRAWALMPAALRGVSARHRRAGAATMLALRWTVDCGPPVEIATSSADHALLLETGFGALAEDGAALALETWTAPDP